MADSSETFLWIQNQIHAFWSRAPENSLHLATEERAWGEPLIGVARGDDPLFAQLKADIGPFYWTPQEAFAQAFPEGPVLAEDLSIISWVLPQTESTRRDQRAEKTVPSERWARSRDFGEKFNCALRLHLAEILTKAGHPAVAPERLSAFAYQHSERFGLASNWSERHTAHIAGLGTFGLSDGLITRLGKAVRLGSVVVRLNLPETPRPYSGHQNWCLWYAKGTCGACIRRCPADAIGEGGHNKEACHRYIRETTAPYAQQHFGVEATPCGLCQVKIPCEAQIPAALA